MENCVNTSLKWKSLTGALSTSKYEKRQDEIRLRSEKLEKAADSEKVKEFLQLREFVESDAFKSKKKEIDALKYNGSELHQKEREFKKKSSVKKIKNYYKLKDSPELEFYQKHHNADKLKRFLELKEYVESDSFKRDKENIAQERKQKLSELENKKKRFKALKQKLKWFVKLDNSDKFNDFLHFKDSDTFKHYLALEEEVRNYSLKALKKKLNNDKKRYKKEKKSLEKRFKELKKQSHKADKNKEPFENQKELERIKETLAKGVIDQKIKDSDIKQSHEYIKINEFDKLKKNSRVKNAAKYYYSDKYKKFQGVKGGEEEKELKELQEFMQGNYKEGKEKAKQHHFKNSDAFARKQEYKVLKNDRDIKRVLKTEKKQAFKDYQELEGSSEIAEYEKLKSLVKSDDFKQQKSYLKDSKRFKKSDEYQKQQRYKQLAKDNGIKFFLKHKDDKDVEEFRSWNCTFSDDFSDASSAEKWSALPFPASTFLQGPYSQWDEDQCYTKDKNHVFASGKLVLKTKKEEAEGMAWHPKMGFVPKKFSCTAANLNTGKVFSQQFGKFEAKLRSDHVHGLVHVLALSSGRLVPQINLLRYGDKSKTHFTTGSYQINSSGDPNHSECVIKGLDLSRDYHIFTLIWNESLLEWKINGVTIAKQTSNIPVKPMFLNIFAAKLTEGPLSHAPVSMELQWVKAYKKRAEN